MSGQSIMDRVQAARHSIAGQGLAKSVCKATTEQIIGPKKKHLDYLLQCTNEPNVSIPQLADLLIERTQQQNWVIVYKSLITIHNLMNYGNERFTQYLASNNCTFNLGGFIDKAGVQEIPGLPRTPGVQGYDMSTYIRRYAKYLNEKATSYRQMAFDFCKVKRGKDDGLLRTMNSEKLLKALPILQSQLNALIEFDCTPNELTNGVINACFMLLFKDLIRLFACYNDGIINLLEKYFDMNKKQCKEGLDIYKKFLVSMDKVSEFLKVAENVGIDRGDIPDLAKGLRNNTQNAPASLLDALEQHLQSLEGKKGAPPPTSTPKPAGFASALTTISNNSSALNVSEDEKKRILDEENQRLHQLKVEQRLKELQTGTSPTTSPTSQANPFNAGTPTEPTTTATAAPTHQKSVDLFGPNSPTGGPATNGKPSDDLLGLNANPFASNIETAMASAYGQPPSQPAPTSNPFAVNTGWAATNSTNFGNEVDFASAFNNTSAPSQAAVTSQPAPGLDTSSPPGFTPGEYGLPPSSPAHMARSTTPTYLESAAPVGRTSPSPGVTTSDLAGKTGFDAFGEVLQPQNKPGQIDPSQKKGDASKLLAKDLDTSLSSLAGNLQIGGAGQQVKKTDHQWNPKGEHKLTGGTNWQPTSAMPATTWNQQQPAGAQFQQQPMMGGPMAGGMGYGQPGMMQQPMMGMGQPQMMGSPGIGMGGMVGQPQMYGARMQQPMGFQQPRPPLAQQSNNVNDPFGTL